jgi:hypothetical protein
MTMEDERSMGTLEPDDDDGMLDALRALPRHDLARESVERIRSRAHAELERSARRRAPARHLWHAYRRAEPLLVGALAASYLLWAVTAVLP